MSERTSVMFISADFQLRRELTGRDPLVVVCMLVDTRGVLFRVEFEASFDVVVLLVRGFVLVSVLR